MQVQQPRTTAHHCTRHVFNAHVLCATGHVVQPSAEVLIGVTGVNLHTSCTAPRVHAGSNPLQQQPPNPTAPLPLSPCLTGRPCIPAPPQHTHTHMYTPLSVCFPSISPLPSLLPSFHQPTSSLCPLLPPPPVNCYCSVQLPAPPGPGPGHRPQHVRRTGSNSSSSGSSSRSRRQQCTRCRHYCCCC